MQIVDEDMAADNPPSLTERTLIRSVTQVVPMQRMLVVALWNWKDDDGRWCEWAERRDVIALESRHEEIWCTESTRPISMFRTADELREAGFGFCGERVTYGAIFSDPKVGLQSTIDQYLWSNEVPISIVSTSWSPADDDENLQPILQKMRLAARAAFDRRRAGH